MHEQKKIDMFAIVLICFVELNCISYLVRSGGQNLFRTKSDFLEAIGFPFLISKIGGLQGSLFFQWYALAGDIILALSVSYIITEKCAHKMPFTLRENSVPMQFSLRSIFLLFICFALLLSVSRLDTRLQSITQDLIRFIGPIVIGLIWMKNRQASWLWLVASGTCLMIMALLIDEHITDVYNVAGFVSIIIIHIFVPVWGLLCALVLVNSLFVYLQQRDKVREK
jgi:hypothetical protein